MNILKSSNEIREGIPGGMSGEPFREIFAEIPRKIYSEIIRRNKLEKYFYIKFLIDSLKVILEICGRTFEEIPSKR